MKQEYEFNLGVDVTIRQIRAAAGKPIPRTDDELHQVKIVIDTNDEKWSDLSLAQAYMTLNKWLGFNGVRFYRVRLGSSK